MKFYNKQMGALCLNRGWKFIEEDLSVLPKTKDHNDVYGFSKGGAAKGPAEAGFDDSDWEDVTIPHDWVTKHDFCKKGSPNQGYKERGIGWYRYRFELSDEDREKQILLEFEGMSCDAEIYVNGSNLKRNFSGYNSFCVDMTDMANFGITPNVLAIKLNASAWEGWWYEGAGIYRNVWMVKKSPVHIAYNGVYVKPEIVCDKKWKINVTTEVENSFEFSRDYKVVNTIIDPKGNEVVTLTNAGESTPFGVVNVSAETEIDNPSLWDVDSPALYCVHTEVFVEGKETDFVNNKFGFRDTKLDAKTGYWLNGKNIKLKGFCNHQDHAGVGVAVPYAIKKYRVELMKQLGANAYRCAHNTDPEIIDICDELGMMVMEENRTFISSDYVLDDIRGMVKNARNHPSVILYSAFNEEPLQGTGKGRRMAGRMQQAIREMDDTRPVLGAFNGGYMEEEGAATILDAVGINYNPARYDDFHEKYPDTPLIGSETASAFMVRGEYETDYNKNLIAEYDDVCALWGNTVKDAWKYVKERPFVAGTFVWTGFDYRGEPTPFEWPSVATFFGTYDSCGFEKDICSFYKAFWTSEPMVHITSPWCQKVDEGTPVRVMVVSNCTKVEVAVNGKSLGILDINDDNFAEITVPYEVGTLSACGYTDSGEQIAAKDEQITAGSAAGIVITTSKTTFDGDGHDAIAVNVSLVDVNGTVIPNGDNMVNFNVQSGEILGVGNGDPNSHEPDVAPFRKLYHGKAQCIISNSGMDEVKVKVSVDGTECGSLEATVTLPVKPVEYVPYVEPVVEQVITGWKMYYKTFTESPDPNPRVDKNDMNSFEPVDFNGKPQPQLADKLNEYGLYRAETEFTNAEDKCIYISNILGYAWIYIDGKLMTSRNDSFGGQMMVDLAGIADGKHVITVVIHNANEEWPNAGICSPVTLKKKNK